MKTINIKVTGIVQGVGFRPFVYNLARRYKLSGWVQNSAEGVFIEAQGEESAIHSFLSSLKTEAPPLAVMNTIEVSDGIADKSRSFVIKHSVKDEQGNALVSPDVATCGQCAAEIKDEQNRRLRYPFTNCTNCGPRYSIIENIPYDREHTSMKEFQMCKACQAEYTTPSNRRFHAQPNACSRCGPQLSLFDSKGQQVRTGDILLHVRQCMAEGHIVAIKGIGGYHLSCDAKNREAVARLRRLKQREYKPFAVMCGSMEAVKSQCQVSFTEEKLLTGSISPIVLLRKSSAYSLGEAVAPGNPRLGVMLPYAPLHHLLLEEDDVWVMTSGNTSDQPIAYLDEDALARLSGIADFFLLHNRAIRHRVEDSLVIVNGDEPLVLRRGRGFVPAPVLLGSEGPQVLACGAELKNTFCLTRGNKAFLSNHNGDLEGLDNYTAYAREIEAYKKLFAIKPQVIAHDLHPRYLSTQYAQSQDLVQIGVQHHHAHIASVLAEHDQREQVLGIAFDGTGYGTDGHLWGGEFMAADMLEFHRLGHCRYIRLPGGTKAIEEPWRVAAWLLSELYGPAFIDLDIPFVKALPKEWPLVLKAAEKGINSPLTSSAGRLFDIAAALLGICTHSRYEGQAAIELEYAATGHQGSMLPYDIIENNTLELDFRPCFQAMVAGIKAGRATAELAAAFHQTMAAGIIDMTQRVKKLTGLQKAALSGGVFQNILLLTSVKQELAKDMTVLANVRIPPNDGGVSLGQAVVARERSK